MQAYTPSFSKYNKKTSNTDISSSKTSMTYVSPSLHTRRDRSDDATSYLEVKSKPTIPSPPTKSGHSLKHYANAFENISESHEHVKTGAISYSNVFHSDTAVSSTESSSNNVPKIEVELPVECGKSMEKIDASKISGIRTFFFKSGKKSQHI